MLETLNSFCEEPPFPWKVLNSLVILSLVVPLDSQGESGLLGRGRSRPSCCLITSVLSVGSSAIISSIAMMGDVVAPVGLPVCAWGLLPGLAGAA